MAGTWIPRSRRYNNAMQIRGTDIPMHLLRTVRTAAEPLWGNCCEVNGVLLYGHLVASHRRYTIALLRHELDRCSGRCSGRWTHIIGIVCDPSSQEIHVYYSSKRNFAVMALNLKELSMAYHRTMITQVISSIRRHCTRSKPLAGERLHQKF